jgi:hypothetical protein
VLWLALHDIAAAEGENFVEHKELRRIAREALASDTGAPGIDSGRSDGGGPVGADGGSRKSVCGDGVVGERSTGEA